MVAHSQDEKIALFDKIFATERAYWQTKLEGLTRGAEFPVDYLMSEDYLLCKDAVVADLGETLSARLLQASHHRPTLAFAILVAALKMLIHKFGHEDIAIGTTIHEQHATTARFNRVLVLRDRVVDTMTVREVLSEVQQTLKQAYANQRYPYRCLLSNLKLQPLPGREELCKITVSLDGINDRSNLSCLRSDAAIYFSLPNGATRTAAMEVRYNTALFRRITIELITRQYQQILGALLDSPDAKVSEIGQLTPRDFHRIVVKFNETQADHTRRPTAQTLFEQVAASNPSAFAVSDGKSQITFQELNKIANRVAWGLKSLGVRPGQCVGVHLRHSATLIAALLGVWKVGAAYVPLDPENPSFRLLTFCQKASAIGVLTESALSPALRGESVLWDIEEIVDRGCSGPDHEPPYRALPEDLAYIIFTSGSTGTPKGVMISHEALRNYVCWAARVYFDGHACDVPLYSSLGFDLTITSIFPTLITGGRILVYPKRDGSAPLERIIKDNVAQLLKLTPSHLRQIKEWDNRGSIIRKLIVGGEALDTALAKQTYTSFGGAIEIFNEYGPTEATVGCMIHKFDPQEDRTWMPIGVPADNVQLYVLDSNLRPALENAPGELYIAGDSLSLGYVGDPGLTAEKFVPQPFASGQRMYSSGDIVRRLPEGVLEYLGRRDHQVKYHGFRVELHEIGILLSQHPQVRDSVVVMKTDSVGNALLVAYYTSRQVIESRQLRQFLAARLPAEIVPNLFVHMKRLPLNLNGKTDLSALPTVEEVREKIEGGSTEPRTPVEKQLALVWCEVLGLKRVGIHDNFFDLGGDSILSLQLVAKAARIGVRFTPSDIFKYQTIARLAEKTTRLESVEKVTESVAEEIPLTPIQRWFFEQDIRERNHFNQTVFLTLKRDVDRETLEEIFAELVSHHDALRLKLVQDNSGWHQSTTPWRPQRIIHEFDLTNMRPENSALAVEAAASDVQRSIDLAGGLLLRAALFRLWRNQSLRLLIVAHHLAMDSFSWRVLLDDLQLRLQPGGSRQVSTSRRLDSFRKWAHWLRREAQSSSTEEELAYWQSQVRGATQGLLFSKPSRPNLVGSVESITSEITPEDTDLLLRECPRRGQTVIQEILLAALGQTLSPFADDRPILIDVERHGRDVVAEGLETSSTIGWFTSLFPLALDTGSEGGPEKWLQAIRKRLQSVPRNGLGYGLLRYLNTKTASILAALPEPQISFNYLGQIDPVFAEFRPFDLALERTGPSRSPHSLRKYMLEVEAKVIHGRLHVEWIFNKDLLLRENVIRMAEQYKTAIQELVRYCCSPQGATYSTLCFPRAELPEVELKRLLQSDPAIEDIYGLSPIQEAMLFHALEPGGAYLIQFRGRLSPPFETAVFRKAWDVVIRRHQILRTHFAWEGLSRPVQMVKQTGDIEWEELDWTGLPRTSWESHLKNLRDLDRKRGINPARCPLLRLKLVRLGENQYEFLCSTHHLILDGWSTQLLLREVLSTYRDSREGIDLHRPTAAGYGGYISWLRRQDSTRPERYWRKVLAGFRGPGLLPLETPERVAEPLRRKVNLSVPISRGLEAFARLHRLTLNTVVEGAWAIALSRYTGQDDVVFGVTVAGRPPDLPDMESILGPFINTVLMRVSIENRKQLVTWLCDLQRQQSEMQEFEHSSLFQIYKWADIAPGTELFNSIVVFENYPVDRSLGEQALASGVSQFEIISTGHSLALVVTPGVELGIEIWDDGARRLRADCGLFECFCSLLAHLSLQSSRTVGQLRDSFEEAAEDASAKFLRLRRNVVSSGA